MIVLGTVGQAAERLGVDAAAIWEMVADGHLHATERYPDGRWKITSPTIEGATARAATTPRTGRRPQEG